MTSTSSYSYIVLVFSLVHLSQCWIIPKELQEFGDVLLKNCTEKVKLSQGKYTIEIILDVVLKARNGTFPDPNSPDEKIFKCYLLCTFQTAKILKDDKTIDVEKAINVLPESIRTQHEGALKACATEKGADDCDSVFKMHKCMQKKDGKVLKSVYSA